MTNPTRRALIVDDSLTVRMDLAEAFRGAGFEALLAASLAQARAELGREKVSIVVLDVVLPDGDGLDFLGELRAGGAHADLPVLLLSSEADVSDRIRGLRVGADDYVGKPYDAGYVVARAAELVSARSAQERSDTTSVLVIDDSTTFREALRRALEGAGYSVLVAASGEEGLRLAAATRPSLVIVDSVMPGIDGTTVIRKIRLDAALRAIPCVLLTGSEGVGAELRALDAGADAFLRKEEDAEVVLARLGALLRGTETKRAAASALLGRKRVMAVDDDRAYLEDLAAALRTEGYDVVLAGSGEEAIDMLSAQSLDGVLLDAEMPGSPGWDICRRIKESPIVRDTPIILLTSGEGRDATIDALAAGADDSIAKSSDFEVLMARVRAQTRRRQVEDEHRKVREELLRGELVATEERAARRLAEARAALVDKLERKNQELEAFSYSVSHDLRAPLRAIDGFSQVLLEEYKGKLDDRGRGYLQRVRANAQRMAELIDDMLQLSRVGRADLRRGPVDLGAIAEQCLVDLRQREPERRVELVAAPGMVVQADRGLVRILLENLVGNAWKFTSKVEQARIELGEQRQGGAPVYFVRDNGAGFDPKLAEKLFRPFQRLHRETEFPGTGIGLATVHRIVDRHGGRVWAEGAPDKGATVFFTIPPSDEE